MRKELEYVDSIGLESILIQFKLGNWGDFETDRIIEKLNNVSVVNLEGTRKNPIKWLIVTIIEILHRRISSRLTSPKRLGYAISKRSVILHWHLKNSTYKVDWLIAHNPPSFAPALYFAKQNKISLGFDIEDYHSGESPIEKENILMKKYLQSTLCFSDYCSFASPLIEKEIQKDLKNELKNTLTLLNGFNINDFQIRKNDGEKIKLVWYSQNIDFGRGLELFLVAIEPLKDQFELTLIGDVKPQFNQYFQLSSKKYIKIINPLSQIDLHFELCGHDVGLALDYASNRNREIALTNKILTYAQSGLFIFGLSTLAQDKFLKENELAGLLLSNNHLELANGLNYLLRNKKEIIDCRDKQFENGKKLSWQNISKPLKNLWFRNL